MNIISITGRLGKDPVVRYTQSGKAVANLSVAVNEYFTDGAGEKQEHTTWIPIVAWQNLGENCGKYLTKGSKVAVVGNLRGRMWEDKEGNKRYVLEVRAQSVDFLDPATKASLGSQEDALPGDEDLSGVIPEDDIPF